jgi:LacI family transcriptional regulator
VPNLGNEFYAGLVREWEKIASLSSFEMLVVASGEDPLTEARRIQSLIARQIDGLLVVAAQDEFGSTSGFPARLPPTVLVDRARNHANFDTVCSDNLDAAYRGTRHLLELGHRDVTLLISSVSHAHLRDRVEGYRRALGDAGLSAFERISFGGGTIEGCRAAIEQDLRRSNPPTAIFAATYYATLGAVKAINALDLVFPEEISLLGFEHSEWMMAIRPYIARSDNRWMISPLCRGGPFATALPTNRRSLCGCFSISATNSANRRDRPRWSPSWPRRLGHNSRRQPPSEGKMPTRRARAHWEQRPSE